MAAPLRTELGRRPHTQPILLPHKADRLQKAMLWSVAVLAGVFIGVAVAERLWLLAWIAVGLAALLGAVAWVMRLRASMLWSATWHRDHVVVHDGRHGPTRTWREPLTAFTGVARRGAYLAQGNDYMPGRRVHGVVLEHPAAHKSVLLHAQRQPIADEVLTDYARQLHTGVIP